MERKIREIRTKLNQEKNIDSLMRIQEVSNMEQPAGKRRKLNKHEYKKALEQKNEANKREIQTREDDQETGNYKIFDNTKTKKPKNKNYTEKDYIIDKVPEPKPETRWEKAWTQEEWTERIRKKNKHREKEEMERTGRTR